ncbi:MAG: molecular chaperone DnaJ [Actinobacteria bacterium]|nr:MAG: molecular chaperone DnaJ [Actinomycetota bacterium]
MERSCSSCGDGQGKRLNVQREWFEKDFYATLGVASTATAKEITTKYRKLARQFHPDANPNNASAEERFKEVAAAYDVLGDEATRKEYDEVRSSGSSSFRPGSFSFDGNDMGDVFSQMFGQGRRRGGSGVGPQRGNEIETSITLDFADAINGITTMLHLTSDAECTSCKGNGARPGTSAKQCPQCRGRGVVEDDQGVFAFSSTCPRCNGRAVIIESPCVGCRGTGVEKRAREVNVRIPAGVDDGQRIRLKGRGAPGRNNGPAGDLIVLCRVNQHVMFGRDGSHLTVQLPITFTQAALGTDLDVPTLEGALVKLRLKAGTQSGSRHRVKGKGIANNKSTGDLIVTVNLVVPGVLNDQQRQALTDFAAASQDGEQG